MRPLSATLDKGLVRAEVVEHGSSHVRGHRLPVEDALRLAVLDKQGETPLDGLPRGIRESSDARDHALACHWPRPGARESSSELGAACSDEAVETDDLARVDLEAHVKYSRATCLVRHKDR